jgi:CRP/FNR family cyclic AMP-dependent transcriptional regulator
MKNLELILAKHPFFHGIPKEYPLRIARLAKIVQFKQGDILFKEGENADKFCLIIKGTVAIETLAAAGSAVIIQTVEDGEMLGWSWLVAPYKYRFSARAVAKTEMIVLNGVELRNQCEKAPRLGFELMKLMVQAIAARLEQTRLLALDVYGKKSK